MVKAEPALLAAQEALNTLNKNNLTELKSFGSPPGAVTNVTAAVMGMLNSREFLMLAKLAYYNGTFAYRISTNGNKRQDSEGSQLEASENDDG